MCLGRFYRRATLKRAKSFKGENKYTALFIFKDGNPVRKTCVLLRESKKFDMVILALIVISSVFLAVENPLDN